MDDQEEKPAPGPMLPLLGRPDAPLYLARYRERQKRQRSFSEDNSVPPFLARARARRGAPQHAASPEETPFTLAWAQNTKSKEIIAPPTIRGRAVALVDVHILRHGETQGYSADGGLSYLGRWQAHRRGDELSRRVAKEGETVRIVHAPTARACETAEHCLAGLQQGLARYGKEAMVEPMAAAAAFRNFQVLLPRGPMDPTQAFYEYETTLERYEALKTGDRPGWLIEMDRFWRLQAGGGDPIEHWLSIPMLYFEPPALVVRRFWQEIVEQVRDFNGPGRVICVTHSGPMRALAASALGYDPGEPYNCEEVRVRVSADFQVGQVTFRNKTDEVDLAAIPPWPMKTWPGAGEGEQDAAASASHASDRRDVGRL